MIYPRLKKENDKYIISLIDTITEKEKRLPPYTDSRKATYSFLTLVDSIQNIIELAKSEGYCDGYENGYDDGYDEASAWYDEEDWEEDWDVK